MAIATSVLSVLIAVAFFGSGAMKLAGAKQSIEIRDRLAVGAALWRGIGVLEVAGAVGLFAGLKIPLFGVAAATGLALLMIGGIVYHARGHDLRHAPPAAMLLVLAVATAVVRYHI